MSGRAWEPARTPHDCPACGALPGHQRPELLASDWLAAHDAQVRAEALAPIKALDDYVCGALMAAKHGSYDGRSVESHLERLLDKVRAAMEAKG